MILNKKDVIRVVRSLPKNVREIMQDPLYTVYLAGGYIRSKIVGEEPNDIDLFVSNPVEAAIVAQKLGKEIGVTENAITVEGDPVIQVVKRWTFGSPGDCLAAFDFTICQALIRWQPFIEDFDGICHDNFYVDLAARRLVYTSPEDDRRGGPLIRMLKYYGQGYHASKDTIVGVVKQFTTPGEFDANIHLDRVLEKIKDY